ncbi:low temperature requirement protein A [Rugosimonospora africana]|uniref:Membrane protein n=1 Tax=Rugosimonospora africana TaxID=556532 RepID=A0A8J3QTY1_9ACTN|nr:low temperature requirement protein A [Rugosimonospora africana]GIH14796.1 membrane protein [Rugosimonospora africana]
MAAPSGEGHGLRVPGTATQVTPTELFFDLVYVLAVTQLTRLLREDLTWRGAVHTTLLLLAVWWAWTDTAWTTNWFDPNQSSVRLMLLVVMMLSLVLSGTLTDAYGGRGLWFAGAYAAIQLGRTGFAVARLARGSRLRRNFQRFMVWKVVAAALWIAGGLVHESARTGVWAVGVVIEYAAAPLGFYVPGLGRSGPGDWQISGEHLAARYQQFVLVALGESVLVAGTAFDALPEHPAVLGAFVVVFAGSVALWWIYFDRFAEAATRVIGSVSDPGRLGRSAYTYFQLPIIAGVIVSAVGDDLVIAHPGGPPNTATTVTVLAGPALFLIGHALFKKSVFNLLSPARLGAVALLGALAAVAPVVPPTALSGMAAAVVVAVAVYDRWRQVKHPPHRELAASPGQAASPGEAAGHDGEPRSGG